MPTSGDGFVAPVLPPTAPAPAPAKRVNFFRAFFLFWLFPKRLGPHLAVGPFWRAFAAHLLSLIIAMGLLAAEPLYDWTSERFGEVTGEATVHALRVVLADTGSVAIKNAPSMAAPLNR